MSLNKLSQLYITYGSNLRMVALATGLHRDDDRNNSLIWFSKLLYQHKGIAYVTSADADLDLGMRLRKWRTHSDWLLAEGWIQVEEHSAQGHIWGCGPKWQSIDWESIAAQAKAEHAAAAKKLSQRPNVKAAARLRRERAATQTMADRIGHQQPMEHPSISPQSTMPLAPRAQCDYALEHNGIPETPAQGSDLSPSKPLSKTSSKKDLLREQLVEEQSEPSSSSFIQSFFQDQPSAEVDPQASGLSASSPAEISEQPKQPKAEINTPPAVEGDHVLEEYPSLIPVEASSLAEVEPCSPELNARLRKAFGDEEQIWLNSETTSNSSQSFMVEGHSPGLGLVVLVHPSERYYGFRLESLGPDGLLLRNQSSVDQCNRIVEGDHSAVDRQACLTN